MSWITFIGFTASLTVLASCCMTTIVSLRSVAIASNLLFISYGMLGHIYPVFFLHLALLPINLVKLHRINARPSHVVEHHSQSPSDRITQSRNTVRDEAAIETVRIALDDIFTDQRFFARNSMSASQIADHILTLVLQGERDPNFLKTSAFRKLLGPESDCSQLHRPSTLGARGKNDWPIEPSTSKELFR